MKTFGGLARQGLTAACVLLALAFPAQARATRATPARAPQNDQNVCATGGREAELFEAIKNKDSARVDALLAAGVSPNARSTMNYAPYEPTRLTCATALMYAARVADAKIVESLLAAKADVSALDNSGRYIWGYVFGVYALQNVPPERLQDDLNARLQVTKLLIAAGVKLDVQESWDNRILSHESAIFLAAAAGVLSGDLRILQTVISSGASVKNNDVLAYATWIALNDVRYGRGAPGAAQVVRTLLDDGANVNAQNSSAGETALLVALKNRGDAYDSLNPKQQAEAAVWAEIVKLLLAAGADPNRSDRDGNSPLPVSFNVSWLAYFPSESEAVIKALLAAGADVNSRDGVGDTILSRMASAGGYGGSYNARSLALLKYLIANGADVNTQNKEGQTPILLAARTGSWSPIETFRVLLTAGADVNLAGNNGETPLLAAIAAYAYSRAQEIKERIHLLVEAGANVNAKNGVGDTALTLALQVGGDDDEIIHALLAAGADVNLANNSGEHSLIVAVKARRSDETIRALLGAGARADLTDASGDTALIAAAKVYMSEWPAMRRAWPVSRDDKPIQALVAAGANVTIINREGESALTVMVTKPGADALPSIRAMLAAAGRKRARDYPRAADLLIAIRRAAGDSPADVVRELIKAGANVNAADESGRPALLVAAVDAGNAAVVRALLEAGARVNAKDKEGDTALVAAVREYLPGGDEFVKNALHRNTEVVRALLDAGADARVRGRDGQSAIQLAEKSGNRTLVGMIERAARR